MYVSTVLESPIEYLKGVGPLKGDMLRKELNIFTFGDLLNHFPLRHIDRTQVNKINEIKFETEFAQVKGNIIHYEILGANKGRRLVAQLQDNTGNIELVWFQGIRWIEKLMEKNAEWLVYGRVSFFSGKPQMAHPEMEIADDSQSEGKHFLEPIYPTTEKLKARGLNGRQIGNLVYSLLPLISVKDLPENIPQHLIDTLKLMPRLQTYNNIHFPPSIQFYNQGLRRLKFEELFIAQIKFNITKVNRNRHSKGILFGKVGNLFNSFYEKYLPFQLTGAQKRVLKEIRNDTARGHQMNRLLQGDVGSGKTIVALLSMLLAADNNYQSCIMAPTEILAQQHFQGLTALLKDLPVQIKLLTGSTKTKDRKIIFQELQNGSVQMLVGTHAIIEDKVQFKNLGLAIIDEQHRFGVEQRAKLWEKSEMPPHILVMTATPIPRTLAMTVYGDLDYSIMDELPPGRLPVLTIHRFEPYRAKVMEFVKTEIDKGRQAFIIYPLIEESEKLAYEDLMQGYEQVKSFFPEHKYKISMLHGKMPAEQKEENMRRFVTGDTQILVSTTVIEVGVNIPNATVMVIESSEKFGLSQLHQLRGRVGRGAEKSYCILLTGQKLGADARERIKIMCATNDGFKIAEKDLELRGPGEIEGTRQSGELNFKLASIVNDKEILEAAKLYAERIVEDDEFLEKEENLPLKNYLLTAKSKTPWGKIA